MDTVPTFPSVGLKEVTPVSLVIDKNGAVGQGAWQRGGACVKIVFKNARCCDVLSRQCYSRGS